MSTSPAPVKPVLSWILRYPAPQTAIALLPEGDAANRKSLDEALARFEGARDAEEQ